MKIEWKNEEWGLDADALCKFIVLAWCKLVVSKAVFVAKEFNLWVPIRRVINWIFLLVPSFIIHGPTNLREVFFNVWYLFLREADGALVRQTGLERNVIFSHATESCMLLFEPSKIVLNCTSRKSRRAWTMSSVHTCFGFRGLIFPCFKAIKHSKRSFIEGIFALPLAFGAITISFLVSNQVFSIILYNQTKKATKLMSSNLWRVFQK